MTSFFATKAVAVFIIGIYLIANSIPTIATNKPQELQQIVIQLQKLKTNSFNPEENFKTVFTHSVKALKVAAGLTSATPTGPVEDKKNSIYLISKILHLTPSLFVLSIFESVVLVCSFYQFQCCVYQLVPDKPPPNEKLLLNL